MELSIEPEKDRTAFWHHRWIQLAIGIVCMGLVVNLQYAWTLFVVPMDNAHHWRADGDPDGVHHFHRHRNVARTRRRMARRQVRPAPCVIGGSICAALGWIIDAHANSLAALYIAAVIAGIGAGAAVTVIPIANMIQSSGYHSTRSCSSASSRASAFCCSPRC